MNRFSYSIIFLLALCTTHQIVSGVITPPTGSQETQSPPPPPPPIHLAEVQTFSPPFVAPKTGKQVINAPPYPGGRYLGSDLAEQNEHKFYLPVITPEPPQFQQIGHLENSYPTESLPDSRQSFIPRAPTEPSDDDLVSPPAIVGSSSNQPTITYASIEQQTIPVSSKPSFHTLTPVVTPTKSPFERNRAVMASTTTTTTTTATATTTTTISSTIGTNHTVDPSSKSASLAAIHPLLIYSIRYEIRSFDLSGNVPSKQFNSLSNMALFDQHHSYGKSSPSKTLIAGLKNTIGLDFYFSERESYIFWTDVIEERIMKGAIVNGTITNVDVVVQSGLATAEGLAIDWIGMNIYWVESTLDHIEVANMRGTYRKTLIAGDMESPRAIAVDPRYGLLFWTDWDKKSPRIERATMSGDDRKTLVNIRELNGGWPNGLTLDYEALKIYWIDANSDSIHVVDYEGNNHRPLLRKIKSLGHPFSITLFENNLYWTDWKTNSVSMASKHNGSEAKELQRLPNRLFDIKVFHPSRQPRIPNQLNPCFVNNGNCSHLCLLSSNSTRKCDCPHLMKLSQDGLRCETYERVLLIGRTNEIRAVDMSKPLHHIMAPISVPKVFNPRQFEYDAKSRTLYWADSQTNEVKRVHLAGNNIETIMDVVIESPSGLALDWISGNIYVSSAAQGLNSPGKIFISNLNGEYISILMDNSQGIISPKSLAIHPLLGLLFGVDENESGDPIIFMAGMDGKNKRTIAGKQIYSHSDNPSNLAMDLDLNRVYWVNQAMKPSENASIQYYDIFLDRVITIYDEAEVREEDKFNPGVISVDGDYLIMSRRSPTEAVIRAWKHNVNDLNLRAVLKTQSLDQISALRVYNASSQVGVNACSRNNGDCSQLCVPTNSTHRTCKCTMGYTINPANETECTGKDLFLIFSYNLGMKGISLEPGSSPDDYYLPPINKAFRASSIDYVHRDNLIYWVDNEEGSITKINRDTTNFQVIVQGLESEECIGIDWVAGNIYWLDPYYDIIEVARLNGSSRYVIVSGEMDKANGIVVNPIKGYIVWSDIGSVPKIEIARLDGSERRVIVNTHISHVDDLAIDYLEDYIYWVDSSLSTIERIKADGTSRQLIYNGNINQNLQHHMVSIAIYRDHLYVADSVQNNGSILRFNKNNSSDYKIIQRHLGDGIRDIAVYAEQPLPSPDDNPCVSNNGGCQDLCLFLGERGKKRCICSHGKLNTDGLTCKSYDTFLLYSKLSTIDSLHVQDEESFNNSPFPPIALENRASIISLTVDYGAKRVIYSEITRDQICSVLFNGTDRKVLVEKQSLVEGIAFANDQLYWTSIHDNSISRLNTTSLGVVERKCQGDECKLAGIEKLVRLSPEDKPRGIAVDSCTSFVYWTNWNTNAAIQRAGPQTGYKVESIIKTNIRVPNGIAIDQKRRKLYWCDARLDKIEACDMDGTNRIVLVSASPQHPFALSVWKDYVFWTDWLARGVFRADKYTGQQVVQVKKVAQRPMGIAVAASDTLECPALDLCSVNNGGCDPGYKCLFFRTVDGESKVECIPPHSKGVPSMIVPGCRGSDNSTRCSHAYKQIIFNGLERFTELTPTNEPDVAKKHPEHQATDFETRQYPSPTLRPSIPMSSPINRSESTTAAYSKQPTSSSSTTTTTTATPTTTTTTPPSSIVATPTVPSAPVSLPTTPAPSQAPLTNSSQPPPCQILPASIQPTTTDSSDTSGECKKSQYKCYLSDKLICIPSEKRCDGTHDCPSKEDENDCYLSKRDRQYNLKHESSNWHRYVTVILVILAAALAALFLVFGNRSRRRWFVANNGFNHRKMFDDNGTNIEISNPMFEEDDSANLVHCAFSIDLNERTTNFSNPLYERQVLLVNDKNVNPNDNT